MLRSTISPQRLTKCMTTTSKRYISQEKTMRDMPGYMSSSTQRATQVAKEINFRATNLSAGPGAIDLEVLQEATREFTNYNESGMGIFEQSIHDETGDILKLITDCSHRIGKLLQIPNNYQIFFMHGGAQSQFASVPLNICGINNRDKSCGGYINTGWWSQKAQKEADKFVNTVEICKDDGKTLPHISDWKIPENCDYIHLCANETISGFEFLSDPDIASYHGNTPPLVADFTSTLFSRPIDIEKYDMIYASAGKNFGPSGVCIVIAKNELLDKCKVNKDNIPGILSWNEYSESDPTHSIYNTPAVFQIYMTDLILQTVYGQRFNYDMNKVQKWVKRRANTIYQILDDFPQLYQNDIDKEYRSQMNIPFRIYDHLENRVDSVLEYQFLSQAEKDWHLYRMEGHYSVGGMRVSLYTGIPDDSIISAAKFMRYFAEHRVPS